MKKCMLSVLIVFMVFECLLKAEDVKGTTARPAFYFNLGAMIPTTGEYSFPLTYGGFSLDYPLGKNVMISPELNVISWLFLRFYSAPGIQINFRDKKMFVGGGIVVLFGYFPMLLKFNIGGYINDRTKLSVYLLTNKDITGGVHIGATVSFKLGK